MAGKHGAEDGAYKGYAGAGDCDVGLELAPHHDFPDCKGGVFGGPVECVFCYHADDGDDADAVGEEVSAIRKYGAVWERALGLHQSTSEEHREHDLVSARHLQFPDLGNGEQND